MITRMLLQTGGFISYSLTDFYNETLNPNPS